MPKIKMLETAKGSEDGYTVKAYLAAEEYEVGDALAAAFVDDMKVAERLGLKGVADKVSDAVDTVKEAVTGGGKKARKDDPAKD